LNWSKKKNESKGIIRVEPHGIALAMSDSPDETVAMIAWPAIESVAAFKRDVFAYDLICLAITKSDGLTHEVNEQMIGWDKLIAALPQNLPSFPAFEDWFHRVAIPAFKTNWTVLCQRSGPGVKT